MRRLLLILILCATAAAPAFAVRPDEVLKNPVLEARARELSGELRCLICQSESIDESDADIARDLRVLIRQRLTAGDTDQQIKDFLVARYGEFVLLRPVFSWHTAILWGTLPAVLIVGGILAAVTIRRRGSADPKSLSADEQNRVEALLASEEET